MNRPPFPRMMGNNYRGPRPYNNQWRPRGPRPPLEFQFRGNAPFRPAYPPTNPGNEDHWCETCDRGFSTADQLERHKQQHQKCNIDGCQFIAHPKVITKHIQMQHSSGLYKKIGKLDNPEAIQKWREERKKKYPTKTNIEKKAAECKEKIERGEKMALKRDRNGHQQSADQRPPYNRSHSFDKRNQNSRPNPSHYNQRPNENNNTNNKEPKPPPKKIPKTTPKIPSVVEKNKLKPFTGISSLEMFDDKEEEDMTEGNTSECSNNLIEDEFEEQVVLPKEKAAQEPVLCGALTSLMCDYGSSDEETDVKENLQSYIKSDNSTVNTDSKTKDIESVKSVTKDSNENQKDVVNNLNILVSDNVKAELSIDNDKEKIDTVSETNNDILQPVDVKEIDKLENSDDDSGPDEIKNVKITEQPSCSQEDTTKKEPQKLEKKNIQTRKDHRPFNNNYNKYKHKVPSTLLQKLLYKEIRHERNIVLQCIRYIKKMNYFDKSSQ